MRSKKLALILMVSLLVLPAWAQLDDFYMGLKYSRLSVRKLKLEERERISAFKFKLRGGYIYSIPVVPHDWTVNVGNFSHVEDNWECVASGFASHSSGAVNPDYFKNFIVIGVFKPGTGILARPFEVELELTTELDHSSRQIVLRAKDLAYTPVTIEKGF